MDFKIKNIQIAIFVKNLLTTSTSEFSVDLNNRLNNLFSAPSTILPFNNAPPEVPRAFLSSNDGKYSCQITGDRINFFANATIEQTLDELKADIEPKIIELSQFLTEIPRKIVRMGTIGNFESSLENSVMYLKNAFIADVAVFANNPYEINMNYVYRENIAEIQSNIRFYLSPSTPQGEVQNNQLTLQLDINTVPISDSESFTSQQLQQFFLDSIRKITEVLPLIPNS